MFFKMIQFFDAFLLYVLSETLIHALSQTYMLSATRNWTQKQHTWIDFKIKSNFIDLGISLQDVWSNRTVIRRLSPLALISMINPIMQKGIRKIHTQKNRQPNKRAKNEQRQKTRWFTQAERKQAGQKQISPKHNSRAWSSNYPADCVCVCVLSQTGVWDWLRRETVTGVLDCPNWACDTQTDSYTCSRTDLYGTRYLSEFYICCCCLPSTLFQSWCWEVV